MWTCRILWGPQPVAARGEDRVAAVVVGRHGLQIARGPSRGLLLPGVAVEHHFDARTFLEQVCVKAGLPRDAWKADDTELAVFEGRAIEGPFELDLPDGRQPAVAGGFYPRRPGAKWSVRSRACSRPSRRRSRRGPTPAC